MAETTKDLGLTIFAIGDLSEVEDRPKGPAIILTGSHEAIREAAKLFGEVVTIVAREAAQ